MKGLLALWAALVLDQLAGLPLNLYGWGREPLLFTLGVVAAALLLGRWARPALGIIALGLCCAWLVFDPTQNGFDRVLSPTLVLGGAMWLWRQFQSRT